MTPRAVAILTVSAALVIAGCGDPDCRTDGCDRGQVCDDATHMCLDPPDKPNCVETGCAGDLFCDSATGTCIERTRCLSGEGDCDAAQCSTCPTGLVCDGASGFCVPDELCRFVACAVAQRCNAQTLACEPVACALDADCPTGSICAANLMCLAGCRNDTGCQDGHVCTIPDGAEAGSCTARCATDADCPWGERCASADGQAQCAPEPPCRASTECRDGEECRGEICRRPLCGRDTDCGEGEFCLVDTGECVSADCTEDAFEPNSADSPWPLARGRYEGLSVCRGKEDWYAVTSRGTQPLRLTLSHGSTADLDMQVYRDGILVGEAANNGALSVVQIPAALAGELRIRVYPARGVSASYLLFVETGRAGCEEDPSEPNDTPERAARLRSGAAAVFSTCPQDVDFVSFGVDPGGARITIIPLGPPEPTWRTDIGSDASPWRPLPTGADNAREITLAWLDPAAHPLLRSTSGSEVRWNIVYEASALRCADGLRGNQSPELAVPVEGGATVSGALCPTEDDVRALEADWWSIRIPYEGPVRITTRLDTAQPAVPAPELTLLTGPEPLPWRSGVGSDGVLTAVAVVSAIDRPVFARVAARGGLPDMLVAWPAYDLSVDVEEVGECIQDRSEGAGNDTPATASTLPERITAILCDGDRDVYRLESRRPILALADAEAVISTLDDAGESIADVPLLPGEPVVVEQDALEGAVFIAIGGAEQSVVYELTAQ